jgi:membrane protein DedA with SNARE-associated domain
MLPYNIIGATLAAAGGAYLGYQAEPSIAGGMGFAAVGAMQWIIGILILAVGFYFAVVLS